MVAVPIRVICLVAVLIAKKDKGDAVLKTAVMARGRIVVMEALMVTEEVLVRQVLMLIVAAVAVLLAMAEGWQTTLAKWAILMEVEVEDMVEQVDGALVVAVEVAASFLVAVVVATLAVAEVGKWTMVAVAVAI